MQIRISTRLDYAVHGPTNVLMQIEAATAPGQVPRDVALTFGDGPAGRGVPAEDGVGTRRWLHRDGALRVAYDATVTLTRPALPLGSLTADPLSNLRGQATAYLMESRYVRSERFIAFVAAEFGEYQGGAKIAAMRDWIESKFTYLPVSDAATDAVDSFVQRQGICRDFAHVMIAFSRAAAIPARMASVYAPGVTPPDFHAVVQVWLNKAWHLVDATGMADPAQMAIIGVGRDAADIAFLTSWGNIEYRSMSVDVQRVD